MPYTERTLILAIDSCTLPGSVTFCDGDDVLLERSLEKDVSHSATLLRAVDDGLKDFGAELRDVELFAASSGPGSVTGL